MSGLRNLTVSSSSSMRPRLLIFIVAYHAESTIESVLARIPSALLDEYETETLVIDDGSADRTFERSHAVNFPFPLRVLYNPVNQGYGGNQKIGYHYAIKHRFDFVALLHGDGQYAPECLPQLLQPLRDNAADACFGSRMLKRGGALRGGMPLYKFAGNRILTFLQNRLLGTSLSEFHSGYRVYSVRALERLPFDLNTNQFHFDTEIIVQFVLAGLRIVERPIPTYYGDEICRVDGLIYARDVMRAVLRARAQALGLFYDARFDCAPTERPNEHYTVKLDFESPHSFALRTIPAGSRVLDLGCAGGRLAATIRQNGNYVAGVDLAPLAPGVVLDEFYQHDLNTGLPKTISNRFDVILLLDVIEHLTHPEQFASRLRATYGAWPETRIIVSTGNIAFIITRLMLVFGQFNYGKRGILDLTHTRLFTFSSLRRLFDQHGFRTLESCGIAAPFPLAFAPRVGRWLLALNRLLIRVSKRLFSYQMVMVLQASPTLDVLLQRAEEQATAKSAAS